VALSPCHQQAETEQLLQQAASQAKRLEASEEERCGLKLALADAQGAAADAAVEARAAAARAERVHQELELARCVCVQVCVCMCVCVCVCARAGACSVCGQHTKQSVAHSRVLVAPCANCCALQV
jgi:hypothetical protein